jgi:hypothetical protein
MINILKCGTTIVDEALPLSNKSKNPFAYTGIARGKKHKIEVPVTALPPRGSYWKGRCIKQSNQSGSCSSWCCDTECKLFILERRLEHDL